MVQHPPNRMSNHTAHDSIRIILQLRLLVARAANKDSLAWWDDESLTSHAGFLLERLFPTAPTLAARSLALSAATLRHQAACANHDDTLHLYRLDLDGQDALAARSIHLLTIPLRREPIRSIEALREALSSLLGKPAPYHVLHRASDGRLQIEIPPAPAGTSALLHRARTLAWAYLEGAPHEPVFPFCRE